MGIKSLLGYCVVVTTAVILTSLYFLNSNAIGGINDVFKTMDMQDTRGTEDREKQSLPRDYPDLVFLRKFGRVKNLPTAEQVNNMSDKEVLYIYHSYLDNTDFSCKRQLRMGNSGDGGWHVCDDFRYRPIKPCVVYSFGIRDDFSFDDDMARVYGCTVHAFDPSMSKTTPHRRSDLVFFYDLGISGEKANLGNTLIKSDKRKNWTLQTLTEIKAMLHHQNTTLDILKMDIERAEWAVLEDVLQRGELSRVQQFLVEFHYDSLPATVRKVLPILQGLEDSGLRRFHSHVNPNGPLDQKVFPVGRKRCYEISYVNTRVMRDATRD